LEALTLATRCSPEGLLRVILDAQACPLHFLRSRSRCNFASELSAGRAEVLMNLTAALGALGWAGIRKKLKFVRGREQRLHALRTFGPHGLRTHAGGF
jgi:hypothetical protein